MSNYILLAEDYIFKEISKRSMRLNGFYPEPTHQCPCLYCIRFFIAPSLNKMGWAVPSDVQQPLLYFWWLNYTAWLQGTRKFCENQVNHGAGNARHTCPHDTVLSVKCHQARGQSEFLIIHFCFKWYDIFHPISISFQCSTVQKRIMSRVIQ